MSQNFIFIHRQSYNLTEVVILGAIETTIRKIVDEYFDKFVAIRRDLHQHPELGLAEFRTADVIEAHLRNWGITVGPRINKTSVVGTVNGFYSGITVALRADIDALPICEVNDLSYKSINPGVMHACGHDVHMTIQLGAGFVLQQIQEFLPGRVKLFFQQAEETVGGAQTMIAAGVLDDDHVAHVLGMHVCPRLEVGTFGVKYDHAYAASDTVTLHVYGTAAHAAAPHEGVDAIVVASNIVMALQTLISRNTSPLEAAVLSFGQITGGTAHNVIVDHVMLRGTLRTLSDETRKNLKNRIFELAHNIAKAYDAEIALQIEAGYDALVNDEQVTDIVNAVAKKVLGNDNVTVLKNPTMGVEDFAYFAKARPSSYNRLGVANVQAGITAPLHHGEFAVDEEAIRHGILIQVLSVLALLGVDLDD